MKPHTIIGRGRGQWHAMATVAPLDDLLRGAAAGCVVYDASTADLTRLFDLPIVDPELAAGEVNRLGWYEGDYSSLDYVAPDVYARLLRGIEGVRVGMVVKGSIVWEV